MVFRNIFFSSFLSQITNETYREKKIIYTYKNRWKRIKKKDAKRKRIIRENI